MVVAWKFGVGGWVARPDDVEREYWYINDDDGEVACTVGDFQRERAVAIALLPDIVERTDTILRWIADDGRYSKAKIVKELKLMIDSLKEES